MQRDELCKGEWDNDINEHPDKEYTFVLHGYKCRIRRNLQWAYCGYVHLPDDHPDYHKTYSDLEKEINVHGDLTFGEGDGVFGFDCHHILKGDISPVDETMKLKDPKLFPHMNSMTGRYHYWTFPEVKLELDNLAKQFKNRE